MSTPDDTLDTRFRLRRQVERDIKGKRVEEIQVEQIVDTLLLHKCVSKFHKDMTLVIAELMPILKILKKQCHALNPKIRKQKTLRPPQNKYLAVFYQYGLPAIALISTNFVTAMAVIYRITGGF